MKKINNKFGLDRCSAYQIRIGGVKGVLMYDPSLKGSCIEIRKSMIKFESLETKLRLKE